MVGFVEELNEVLNGVVMQVDKMIRGVEETADYNSGKGEI